MRNPKSSPRVAIALGVVAVIVAACMQASRSTSADSSSAMQMTVVPTSESFADTRAVSLGSAARRVPAQPVEERARKVAPPGAPVRNAAAQATTSMIIRNGDVAIEVDSLETAIARVRELAATLGGYVGNVSLNTGQFQVRAASLELKVPAARFDDAMAGMAPLGKVERSNAHSEDVGEEFVDITARVGNSRRLEARLVTLLANRTGKLEDVLAVERELARVREEIERYEGRIRYLASRVATSTIVATVHEKAPLVAATPGTNVIGQAFVRMWRNFVTFVAIAIESLGVLLPVGLIAGFAYWLLKRRRSNSIAAAAGAS